jgi:hypothetical protein
MNKPVPTRSLMASHPFHGTLAADNVLHIGDGAPSFALLRCDYGGQASHELRRAPRRALHLTFPVPSQEHSAIECELSQLEKALSTIYDLRFMTDDLKTEKVNACCKKRRD